MVNNEYICIINNLFNSRHIKMKTFILMWNPAISNYKREDYEQIVPYEYRLSWSIWDYKEVERNDLFYMVKVGEGNTGIVLAGRIRGKAQAGEDWSGRGRQVYYADLDIEFASDFDTPFISTEQLMKEIPGFDWTGGHSGRLLPDDMAEKLETLFDKRISRKRPTSEYAELSLKEKEEYWLKALKQKSTDEMLTKEQWWYEWQERVLYEDENIRLSKNYVNELEIENKKKEELYGITGCFEVMMEIKLGDKHIQLDGYEDKTIVDYMRDREFPLTFVIWI